MRILSSSWARLVVDFAFIYQAFVSNFRVLFQRPGAPSRAKHAYRNIER